MTRIFTICLFLLFGAAAMAQQSTAPEIEFDKLEHNFGELTQNVPGVYAFTFTNSGADPLILSNVKGSCQCTVPEWPRQPIMPGETEHIKVKYNAKRVGPFNKSVTVTSNAAESPVTVLRIKGTVKADGTTNR